MDRAGHGFHPGAGRRACQTGFPVSPCSTPCESSRRAKARTPTIARGRFVLKPGATGALQRTSPVWRRGRRRFLPLRRGLRSTLSEVIALSRIERVEHRTNSVPSDICYRAEDAAESTVDGASPFRGQRPPTALFRLFTGRSHTLPRAPLACPGDDPLPCGAATPSAADLR